MQLQTDYLVMKNLDEEDVRDLQEKGWHLVAVSPEAIAGNGLVLTSVFHFVQYGRPE
jgi:hypothetical protein